MATINITPTLRQHEVYQALQSKDEIFYGGAAGGGKSWLICESRLINCYLYPGYRSFIGREELTRLMQSTYLTWMKVCKYHKIPSTDWHLNGQYHYIQFNNGSRIDLLDLKFLPSDPLYERFGSLEFCDGAIDEAGEINFLAYDVLNSRIGRHMVDIVRPTLLCGGNPKKNWTYRLFYKPWKLGTLLPGQAFIQAKYSDNPFISESYGKQLDKLKDGVMRSRLKDGNWEYEDDNNSMTSFEAINSLFSNTIKPSSEKFLIVDAARYGGDLIVFSFWSGLNWYKVVYKTKQGLDKTADDIIEFAKQEKIPYENILIDEDGVGGGLVDDKRLRGVKGFMGNRSPLVNPNPANPDQLKQNFGNLRAQCCYKMSDIINEHKASVSFTDEKAKELLASDIEQYKKKNPDSDKKLYIIDKKEMKKELGRSPDFGDCFMMRMWFILKESADKQDEYQQKPYEPSSDYEDAGQINNNLYPENNNPFINNNESVVQDNYKQAPWNGFDEE